MLIGLWIITPLSLPHSWLQQIPGSMDHEAHWSYPASCVTMGLISGYLIGLSTDYYTSNSHKPVQEMAQKCSSGAAINIIYGLAVGYLSTIAPIV